MRLSLKTMLSLGVSLLILNACQQGKYAVEITPEDLMDSKETEGRFPEIAIPEDADLRSPRWKGIDLSPKPPVVPLTPGEQQKTFVLRPGYSMTPVLTEPQIKEPAAIQFDGNGRMYVLELRSYMQDIDAVGELLPTSRISRWEDNDNDGIYEDGVVFLDSLVFPRFIVPFGPGTILSMESNEDHVYKYTDTDNDGKADKKELFTTGLGRSGNVEHQTSFLTWAMDNWMYSTYNSKRIKWTPDGVIQEPTGNPYGQWGVTQDNFGQVWFQDGAGGVPRNFNFPIVYGNFSIKEQFQEDFRVPFSLVKLADFEPGMRETKPDGSLNNVTGAAGNDVFRGHRLPADLVNQYFYGEPVGRIVRQVYSEKNEGITSIQNQYLDKEAEFIQSTDPLFRPTDMATAPDGTMYIVDMYRGIIQEGNWTQEGSYLRTKILQYQMDDVVKNGRIWRVTYEGMPRDKNKPKMFEESAAELVKHLEHPNGWWRDKAQQLLILRQDQSVANDLAVMAASSTNELARIHALWILEGLGSLKKELILDLLKDQNVNIRIQALRASETLYKYGEKSLEDAYRQMSLDKDPSVVIQALLSAYILNIPGIENLLNTTAKTNPARGVALVTTQLFEKIAEAKKMAETKYSSAELALFNQGKTIFDSYCATCHGVRGLGTPTGGAGGNLLAPAFSGSPRIQGHPEYIVKTLLHGLTGAIEGKEYEGVMIAMNSNDDQYIAAVASYIRNDFGNKGSFVSPEYVAQIREKTSQKDDNYHYDALLTEIPKALFPQDNWKITASSTALQGVGSTRDPSYAFGFKGWKTEENRKKGNWFQVELPVPVNLTELYFETGNEMHPGKYTVATSMDGENWTAVVSGEGNEGDNTIAWTGDSEAKYLKIENLEDGDAPWGMRRLNLYAR
jgi:mono/diheme cytochrome c family protein/glucose/arabinose dehydrogenase